MKKENPPCGNCHEDHQGNTYCWGAKSMNDKNTNKEIEIVERIVIDYANFSGRESENRGKFREEVLRHFFSYRNAVLEEEKEKFKEALKLWRPYFYRDKITDEDIKALDKILAPQ